MAASNPDFDLLAHLEWLSGEQFQVFKHHLVEILIDLGLPRIPYHQQVEILPEELNTLLTINYEPHLIWNMAFSIFQKMGCLELCEIISARRKRNEEAHKQVVQRILMREWREDIYPTIHNDLYNRISQNLLGEFGVLFDQSGEIAGSKVLLVGEAGAGKTMVLKMAVERWLSGDLWKDRFSYIIHLPSCKLNELTHSSLAELLSDDWLDAQAPVADILSDFQKVLFIIEDLDNLDFNLNFDRYYLCTDSRQQVPIPVLLASVIKGKMVPGASIILSARPTNRSIIEELTTKTAFRITLTFPDEARQVYFELFFPDRATFELSFNYVQEREVLIELCSIPILSWVTCKMYNRIDKLHMSPTDIFNSFVLKAFCSWKSMSCWHEVCALERLCSLALEGLLQNVFHFSEEDLRCVGFTVADICLLQASKVLIPSNRHRDRYMFLHLRIQEFCAAVALLTSSVKFTLPSASGQSEHRPKYTDLSPVMVHVFGLLNPHTGHSFEVVCRRELLSSEYWEYFVERSERLGANPEAMEHHVPLLYCVYETREDDFTRRIMGAFSEVTVLLRSNKDLVVSEYCLNLCHTLRKLTVCVQRLFNRMFCGEPTPSQRRSVSYWDEFCSLLYNTSSLQELEICNSQLDVTAESILSKALKHPGCRISTLKLSYLDFNTVYQNLFQTIIYSRYLTHLSLTCMPISPHMFLLLHNVSTNPACNIQHLSLVKCDLKFPDCERIATLLKSRRLKWLTISDNPLGDEGMRILCNALANPNCVLKSLEARFCCLTAACCTFIGLALVLNKNLRHLDLSVNHLQNCGVTALMLAVMVPTCQLQELVLSRCYVNSEVCYITYIALTMSRSLKHLELGNNQIGDSGLERLSKGLQDPHCILQSLGLEDCMLTSSSCDDLFSIFIHNNSLREVNLLENEFGEGIVRILEALAYYNSRIEKIGLQTWGLDAAASHVLETVKSNRGIIFMKESWTKKKHMTVRENIGQQSTTAFRHTRNIIWHSMSAEMPRVIRELTVSESETETVAEEEARSEAATPQPGSEASPEPGSETTPEPGSETTPEPGSETTLEPGSEGSLEAMSEGSPEAMSEGSPEHSSGVESEVSGCCG